MAARDVLTLAVTLAAAACSSAPERPDASGVVPGTTLRSGESVLVLPVADYQEIVEERPRSVRSSGLLVERAVRKSLEAAGWEPMVEPAPSLASALDRASSDGFAYVLQVEIVAWRDVSANWRDTPDELRLHLRLWDSATRSLVAFGNEALEGAGAAGLVEPTHRLAEPLVQRMLESIIAEVPLPPEAWEGEPTRA